MIRTKRTSQASKQITGINITPFTDVCLVLLIIFMVTASELVKKDPGFLVPLPKASPTAVLPTPPLIASIKADESIYLNNERVTLQTLGPKLREAKAHANGDVQLHIRADKDVRYQMFISTVDIARQNGVNTIGLPTEPLENAPRGE